MPIRQTNNTGYAPIKIFDLFNRSDNAGCTNVLNDNITTKICHDWIYYVTQPAECVYTPNKKFNTNILTAYIFDNYKNRILFDDYADRFYEWDESTDFAYYVEMIKSSIEKTVIANEEKYNKLYYSMIAEFNPLWNVDGETITERILSQTGTDENAKTGSDETVSNRDISETETVDSDTTNTGTDTTAKTGSDTVSKTGTDTDAKTGTETLGKAGTETTVAGNTTYNSSTFYDGTENETTHNTTDTTTFNTTDTTTHNTEDVTEYDSTETVTHNTETDTDVARDKTTDDDTTETTTYNSKDTNTRNLRDEDRKNNLYELIQGFVNKRFS